MKYGKGSWIFGFDGAFIAKIFPRYRTFIYYARLLRYAHNDYLHFVSEMGIFAWLFIFGFFIWYLKKIRECFKRLRKID